MTFDEDQLFQIADTDHTHGCMIHQLGHQAKLQHFPIHLPALHPARTVQHGIGSTLRFIGPRATIARTHTVMRFLVGSIR